MAQVTITLEDVNDEDGEISFSINFDPPLEDPEAILTPAQGEAAFLIEVMQRRASGQTLVQIADEMEDDQYGRVAGGYEPAEVVWEPGEPEPEGNN